MRVHRQIDRAGLVAAKQHLVPGLAAVRRAKDPALIVWSIGMAQRRHIDQIGILGVNAHAGDIACLCKPQMHPGLPRIGRLIDAIAVGDVAPNAHSPMPT